MTSQYSGEFYCFNYLYSFRTKKKLNHVKKFSQERDHYHPVMPKDDINILNCYLNQN